MPRPVQITLPAVDIFDRYGFDSTFVLQGLAGTNLLSNIDPTIANQGSINNPNPTNYNPFFLNASNPNQYALAVGSSVYLPTDPQIASPSKVDPFTGSMCWNRNLHFRSNLNIGAATLTVQGIDTQGQAVTDTFQAPGGFAPPYTNESDKVYAYVTSITCSVDIIYPANALTLKVWEYFESAFIRLDYFYSNAAFSVSVNLTTTDGSAPDADYTVAGTLQKPMIVNNAGIPALNPVPPLWLPLDASVDNVSTDSVVYSTSDIYTAVFIYGTLNNEVTELTFTVLQQGLRS